MGIGVWGITYDVRQWLNLRTEMQDTSFLARRFRAEPFFLTVVSSLEPFINTSEAASALVDGS